MINVVRLRILAWLVSVPFFVSGLDTSKTAGVRICFYSNTASERGTEIAMYEYAEYAEKLLNMKAHIIFPKLLETSNSLSDRLADEAQYVGVGGMGCRGSLNKFASRFNVSFCGEGYSESLYRNALAQYGSPDSVFYPICNNLSYEAAHDFNCDILYLTKAGLFKHAPLYPNAFGALPTMVHSVFNWEPHGNVYAAISPSIKNYRPRDHGNVIPYMVVPPDPVLQAAAHSYRAHFGIPAGALTVCRHGGDDSFNLEYVKKAVLELLGKYTEQQLHFVFLGTESFKHEIAKLVLATPHPDKTFAAAKSRIHFIPATSEPRVKENYFHTCDVMLHARDIGETFGLAIAEFSVRNKPVITQRAVKRYSDFHVKALGSKGYYYGNQAEVVDKVSGFVENGVPKNVDFNCYREYSPENVMETFQKLFLDVAIPLIGRSDVGKLTTVW